jgi:hypothetical protein
MENRRGYVCAPPPTWIVKFVRKLAAKRDGSLIGMSFQPKKIFVEQAVIIAAFWGTPWPAMAGIMGIAFFTLRLRDLWIYPADGTPAEAATDVLIMAGAIALFELYCSLLTPSLVVLTPTDLAHGLAVSMVGIATWRILLHRRKGANAEDLRVFRVFNAALRINAMLFLAAWMIAGSNLQAVPGGHLRDFALTVINAVSLPILYKLQTPTDRSPFWDKVAGLSIFTNLIVLELESKIEALPQPPSRQSRKTWLAFCFQGIFVISMTCTLGIGAWRWAFGDPSTVNWTRLGSNFVALIVLVPLWSLITQFNAATADIMREELAAQKAS